MKTLLEILKEVLSEAKDAARQTPSMYFAPLRGAWTEIVKEVKR
jgi:hypothetical protein